MANTLKHRNRQRPDVTDADKVAALQAACMLLSADKALRRSIALAVGVAERRITGPAVDMMAAILLREPEGDGSNTNPLENIGSVVTACRRAVQPRYVTADPEVVATWGGTLPEMDVWDSIATFGKKKSKKPKAHSAAGNTGVDAGTNHKRPGWRARARAARARDEGQTSFYGIDWRLPVPNPDDEGVPA